MAVRTAYVPVSGTAITAANHIKFPGGWIGYNEVTANQTGITATTDLTTLTVAVTVGASRRIRISGEIGHERSVNDGVTRLSINEGATTLTFADAAVRAAAEGSVRIFCSCVLTPSTGAHTYKLTLARANGTGTVSLTASATNPAFILVEDLGPSA